MVGILVLRFIFKNKATADKRITRTKIFKRKYIKICLILDLI
jgi:hypothetical protein